MKKRAISLLLSLAMVLGFVPVSTFTSIAEGKPVTPESVRVQLVAREGSAWATSLFPYYSNTVEISANTEGTQTHKLTINNIQEPNLVNLTLKPEGAVWCDDCRGWGGVDSPCGTCENLFSDFLPYELDENGNAQVDEDYLKKFGSAIIRYTSVKINGDEALRAPVNVPMLSQDPNPIEINHVDAAIWNGWYNPARRLNTTAVSRVDQGGGQVSFRHATAATIDTIEVEFEVLLVDGVYPEARFERETNGVSLFLGAREALDWRTNPNFWKSNSQRITEDGEYEFFIDFEAKDASGNKIFPDPVDRLSSIALMSHGATFEESIGFLLNARKVPESWMVPESGEGGVVIGIEEVKVNCGTTGEGGTLIPNTWGTPELDGKDIIATRGYTPTEEFVDVELWNGWPTEDSSIPPNRYLSTTAPSIGRAIQSPSKSGSDVRYPDADENVTHFALGDNRTADSNPLIKSIYVKVVIEGIVQEFCDVAGHEDILAPCYECDTRYCDKGCGQIPNPAQNPPCACNACLTCGGPTPCYDCIKIEDDFTLGLITPDSVADGKPSIFDALEILKALVGMTNLATDNPAALITPDSIEDGKPSIFDALEILKFLVNMDGILKPIFS